MKDTNYYLSLYDKFIKSRKNRVISNNTIEIHHIIPRCKGGDDSPSNLIVLTSREHFLAHLILHKSDPTNIKLKKAIQAMFKGDKKQQLNRNFNSRFYSIIREKVFVKIPAKLQLQLLYEKGFSYKKIGLQFGVSDMTVCKWFKIYNINAKQNTEYGFAKPTKEELQTLIDNSTFPYSDITEKFNISRSLLYKWLAAYNLNRPAIYPRPKRMYSSKNS